MSKFNFSDFHEKVTIRSPPKWHIEHIQSRFTEILDATEANPYVNIFIYI